jgi:hypothetical protein
MVGGFNTNVRHLNRVLHVQTESTTRPRPQITTLLFEEGTILHAQRTDWSGEEEGTSLRQRMEAQHREFIGALRAGALDRELGLEGEGPENPGDTGRVAVTRFGEGVIGTARLDELVLAQLASQ